MIQSKAFLSRQHDDEQGLKCSALLPDPRQRLCLGRLSICKCMEVRGYLRYAKCKCGDEIFGHRDKKWCCYKNCTGKGEEDYYGIRYGESNGESTIGAECTGRVLNLTEACDQKCNFYEEDRNRKYEGILRSFLPCNATHVKITECMQEDKIRDRKYGRRNRADEEAFQTHIGNSSSLLLNLDKILTPCKFKVSRFQSFKCTGVNIDGGCLHMTGMVQFW